MSYSLNSFKRGLYRDYLETITGVIKGDTRGLDCGSFMFLPISENRHPLGNKILPVPPSIVETLLDPERRKHELWYLSIVTSCKFKGISSITGSFALLRLIGRLALDSEMGGQEPK